MNGHAQQQMQPQIYTAVYSGVSVYEMEVNGVAVMRRRSDSWLNATQILKVAGVDKGKRTKVLEKEILVGEHEKVQGGYGKYQGTWINYRRGREFCRQYGVEEILRPLLDYDMSADGSGQPGQGVDTPTKEQAMAANRKRFYTQTQDGRQGQSAAGTFFSNISSTASTALAAMNKAANARLNSPAPRPNSASQQRRTNATPRPSQQSMIGSQESYRGNSQQSMHSLPSERSFGPDSTYATGSGLYAPNESQIESQEPPRKRMRPSSPGATFSQPNGAEVSMREGTPTEPNDSFIYQQATHQFEMQDGDAHSALPPLPSHESSQFEGKQTLLLDLFADPTRTDFTQHPAIMQLSGSDLDIPLDQSANTALHWAATLARVSLMRLLISKGASIFRGNQAGETPLMAAVMVNNNLDHSCFPELLDILAPLIEVRDAKGRTILHHISVASGIKGRAVSSKYYLEALLEFLVRSNSSGGGSSQDSGVAGGVPKPIGLMRFMSEMVNARDIAGNTALNLVARIGNRSIIQQLLEVQADPHLANHKGHSAVSFGVGGDADGSSSQVVMESPGRSRVPNSKVDEISRELVPSLTASLADAHSQFSSELRLIQDRIDKYTTQIRDLSTTQKALTTQVEETQSRLRARHDRKQKLQNLRQRVSELRTSKSPSPSSLSSVQIGDADQEFDVSGSPSSTLPSPSVLQGRLSAYNSLNAGLSAHVAQLRSRDGELESKYRKVIALCTGVEEKLIDSLIGSLVQAVESEGDAGLGGGGQDVSRVREFLRRVDMAG
ncbi:apses-domain-containing protein [Tothia fuscella]|uniref:Apses-domain-containing protein n=1 Tax=Tothia fuscella TaxID=1048955 RepID=A0A9P4NQY3_9PEZI|nr:apses-domain-containing protein [Tothia fuscella]